MFYMLYYIAGNYTDSSAFFAADITRARIGRICYFFLCASFGLLY